uniref:Uncharacterized protein n=1 Tax=Ochrobactrum phage ORM_20 TaxID=2985243 RepID=A0A9N6WS84_9VIRU|nr:hypothetical protein ORM20_00202 [Ochrobactrum phage ORM_20]
MKMIQKEVDSSWASGRKIFEYKIPHVGSEKLIMDLVDAASIKVKVELISERHTSLLGHLPSYENDGSNIHGCFWEQSRFRLDQGRSEHRMVVIDRATAQIRAEVIGITSINPLAPCVILIN